MKIVISDKQKKELFISIFQLIKNTSSTLTIFFNDDHMYIQGMDKSHICLFDIHMDISWFNSYTKNEGDESKICLNGQIFHNIISMAQELHEIIVQYDGNPDKINIQIVSNNSSEYNKYFNLPLCDFENQLLKIPQVEYDAEFSINSKRFNELASQLLVFGDTLNIKCDEESISLMSTGINGEMLVLVPIDDLNEYSISEGETVNLFYSLNHIHKMCITNKLSSEIEFGISTVYPMKIKYSLGDSSQVVFYIAPKIEDE
jgi:proliferating cell nuclear antigen PCNA